MEQSKKLRGSAQIPESTSDPEADAPLGKTCPASRRRRPAGYRIQISECLGETTSTAAAAAAASAVSPPPPCDPSAAKPSSPPGLTSKSLNSQPALGQDHSPSDDAQAAYAHEYLVAIDCVPKCSDELRAASDYIMSKVMSQRSDLVAGKHVVVDSVFLAASGALPGATQQQQQQHRPPGGARAPPPRGGAAARPCLSFQALNRTLRQLTKQFPGLAWSLDRQSQCAQVHLADIRSFELFCQYKGLDC